MASGPSDKAVEAAQAECRPYRATARAAVVAAHDPALGLDRSVCLRDAEREIVAKVVKGEYPVAYATIRADVIRDVAEWLRKQQHSPSLAAGIEREFGGKHD